MTGIENYKNHGISIIGDEYYIFWFRGKEHFRYKVTQSLAEKSRKSDKDALEVMFYLENKRWPKEGELENYNKTDVKTYVGDGFTIYEENGKYEIGIEKQDGCTSIGEIYYPITKELKEKAFKSSKDAYEVMIYAETGRWPAKDQDEADREFIRSFPEILLEHADKNKDLFSEDEFEYLLSLAKEKQKNREPYDEDK